ncbi:MAG: hypothetical protein ABI599_10955 [Flavobacteriales bacterium]
MRSNRWLVGVLAAAATYATLHFTLGPRWHSHHGHCGSGHCGWHEDQAGTDQHSNAADPWKDDGANK